MRSVAIASAAWQSFMGHTLCKQSHAILFIAPPTRHTNPSTQGSWHLSGRSSFVVIPLLSCGMMLRIKIFDFIPQDEFVFPFAGHRQSIQILGTTPACKHCICRKRHFCISCFGSGRFCPLRCWLRRYRELCDSCPALPLAGEDARKSYGIRSRTFGIVLRHWW